jgi:hypothetical protein
LLKISFKEVRVIKAGEVLRVLPKAARAILAKWPLRRCSYF